MHAEGNVILNQSIINISGTNQNVHESKLKFGGEQNAAITWIDIHGILVTLQSIDPELEIFLVHTLHFHRELLSDLTAASVQRVVYPGPQLTHKLASTSPTMRKSLLPTLFALLCASGMARPCLALGEAGEGLVDRFRPLLGHLLASFGGTTVTVVSDDAGMELMKRGSERLNDR